MIPLRWHRTVPRFKALLGAWRCFWYAGPDAGCGLRSLTSSLRSRIPSLMTFPSGVFYLIGSLPPFWQKVSHINPFFYMIDGFGTWLFGRRPFH